LVPGAQVMMRDSLSILPLRLIAAALGWRQPSIAAAI